MTTETKTRVLLVEDDLDCLEAVTDALEFAGYHVATAKTGREAFASLEAGPKPHLILLDLMLPDMNGWQFLTAKSARPDLERIPVVLMSGEKDLAQRSNELPVAGYVEKPADLEQLLSAVRRFSVPNTEIEPHVPPRS